MKEDIFAEVRKSQNKIKEQLKYLQTQKERNEIEAINADKSRSGVVNEELFYRQQHK